MSETNNKRNYKNIIFIVLLLGFIVFLGIYGDALKDKLFNLYLSEGKSGHGFLVNLLGYFVIFIGTVVEGEAILISFLVITGCYLYLPGVIIAAALGGSVGDNVYFHLARDGCDKIIAKSEKLQRTFPRIKRMVEKYGTLTVLLSRFLYGLRTAIPLACGSGKMPPFKYIYLNLISAFVWATFYCCAIYYGGKMFTYYFDRFKKIWFVVMPLFILGLIIFFVVKQRKENNSVNSES